MSINFTEINTGNTIVLNKHDIQVAYNIPDEFNILELTTGVYIDVSDSWAYIVHALAGGPPITP